jgi:toxin FitB
MDLLAFEHDRGFVLEALRRGEIDYLEHVGEAMEGDFFRQLINRQVLQRLADCYPTPRKKEEVPVWLHLASEISLKLHGAQSHHAFPRILRAGGLIDALGPQLGGCKTTHPETGDVTLACPGFNRKNAYDRQTPCDQDFLGKFARDTQEQRLHAWFNREVPRCLCSPPLLSEAGSETRRAEAPQGGGIQVIHYLLDTSVVSALRKPKPHGAVVAWLESLREDQIYISAVTMGELQRGVERTRKQNPDKAREIAIWLDQMAASGNLLSMDPACFREWARLRARGSEHLLEEDAMIAATARVHRLKVATRNPSDFALLGVDLANPFKN